METVFVQRPRGLQQAYERPNREGANRGGPRRRPCEAGAPTRRIGRPTGRRAPRAACAGPAEPLPS